MSARRVTTRGEVFEPTAFMPPDGGARAGPQRPSPLPLGLLPVDGCARCGTFDAHQRSNRR
ncbi:MAG: hypothetical protein R6X31_09545, partial [Anaerolineae bacterium]